MKKELDLYKQFVDDLVAIRESVKARWIMEKGWPDLPENQGINEFVSSLSAPQKKVLCQLLQKERDGGIHDTLAFLNEQIEHDTLQIIMDNRPLPTEPFDTGLHYDWTCRCEGDNWPDESI